LSATELLEVASLYSIFPHAEARAWLKNPQRPFRTPHHSASAVALVGGGSRPKPGEISLAHHGVLFLDEFPEFGQKTLENLREPLESGKITIARAQQQLTFPAQFQLIAAMNPCPCGYLSHPRKPCRCSRTSIARYHQKISGPILDRIDLHAEVPYIAPLDLWQDLTPPENSAQVKNRVLAAQQIQKNRQSCLNAHLSAALLKEHCALPAVLQSFLLNNLDKLKLSSRAHNRILKVSRTIADLAQSSTIEKTHLLEAISYRMLDILG
jgi:magnesium chelatase family protein